MKKLFTLALVLALAVTASAQSAANMMARHNARLCGLAGLATGCTQAQYNASAPVIAGIQPAATIYTLVTDYRDAVLVQPGLAAEIAGLHEETGDRIKAAYLSGNSATRLTICNAAGIPGASVICQ